MGLRGAISALIFSAGAAVASPQTDQLVDAMGIPALIAAFSTEGIENGASVDDGILNGQGSNVWAETVRRLYDPARLEEEMRAAFAETLDEHNRNVANWRKIEAQRKRDAQDKPKLPATSQTPAVPFDGDAEGSNGLRLTPAPDTQSTDN